MDTMEKSSRVLLQLFFDEDEYLVLQLNLFSSLHYNINYSSRTCGWSMAKQNCFYERV